MLNSRSGRPGDQLGRRARRPPPTPRSRGSSGRSPGARGGAPRCPRGAELQAPTGACPSLRPGTAPPESLAAPGIPARARCREPGACESVTSGRCAPGSRRSGSCRPPLAAKPSGSSPAAGVDEARPDPGAREVDDHDHQDGDEQHRGSRRVVDHPEVVRPGTWWYTRPRPAGRETGPPAATKSSVPTPWSWSLAGARRTVNGSPDLTIRDTDPDKSGPPGVTPRGNPRGRPPSSTCNFKGLGGRPAWARVLHGGKPAGAGIPRRLGQEGIP